MPGDIVVVFASDTNHLVVREDIIRQSSILLGMVKSFVNVRWGTGMPDNDAK